MILLFYMVIVTSCLFRSAQVKCENNSDLSLDPNYSYCFSYTWLGVDYYNVTDSGEPMTCKEYRKKNNSTAASTPCVEPVVFSDIFSMPDADDLWNTNKSKYVCKRAGSQSCVKYTVSFDGNVQYQTHMCSRVRTKTELIKTGCLTETRNGDLLELCMCESNKGVDKPCNGSRRPVVFRTFVVLILLVGMRLINPL
ncbi:uncharacterized protein LOC126741473 isoform X2 [Anthonomus grandis grandis]|uniref:uncharacterized protein LOC126741473 isoform X2 n=1 Tax=Anthonomus grandis grandis TaxID=2921223 RepID=UPI002166A093|nr:uncharacterized protein LOC126741473 isoform X2 [Anthonomus grandis grandis]